jgi:hypothetical protein
MGGNHWAAELTSYRPSEEAPDFVALVYDPTPGGRKNDDGSTSFGMRFPALILSEYVSDQQVAAQKIADQLNEADAWRENVELLLAGDPDVIRCHEGGGPEDMIMSLVLTMARTRKARDATLSGSKP